MQAKTMSVTKEMAQVSNQLSVALKDMNVEKIASIMDTFET